MAWSGRRRPTRLVAYDHRTKRRHREVPFMQLVDSPGLGGDNQGRYFDLERRVYWETAIFEAQSSRVWSHMINVGKKGTERCLPTIRDFLFSRRTVPGSSYAEKARK